MKAARNFKPKTTARLHLVRPQTPYVDRPWWVRLYKTAAWKKLSRLIRQRRPFCEQCGSRRSQVVDHIRPHRGDWELFADPQNLRALCSECHGKKSARERLT